MLADIPVQAAEPTLVFHAAAARHEHDMIGSVFQFQGVHARLEELYAVYLAILEPVQRIAKLLLLVTEQVFMS